MSKKPDYLLGGRILVKPLKSKEEKIDSIVIPSTANSELSEGLVVMVDKEITKYIDKGHIVVYPTGAGVGQFVDNEPHLWLQAQDVWAGFEIDKE